jgi:parallel beta-helix repeat protein
MGTSDVVIVDCNGSGDYYTIQEAIDAVPKGSTIIVKQGVYEPIAVHKELKIFAEDKVVIYANGQEECIWVSQSNTTIDGFTCTEGTSNAIHIINEKWSSNRSIIDNITISNCTTYNNGRDGQGAISAYVVSNLTIKDCHVHDNVYTGILLSFVSNITVDSCIIKNNIGPGIGIYHGVVDDHPEIPDFSKDGLVVKNCIIQRNMNGISSLNIPHLDIINSTITSNEGWNIFISYGYPDDIIDSPVIRILDNNISNAHIGLQYEVFELVGREIRYTKDDILIKGNTFSGNDKGLLLYDVAIEAIVTQNNFIDNELHASFMLLKPVKNYKVSCFENNYWDNNIIGIKVIRGRIEIFFPWFGIDRNPAKTIFQS